MGQTSRLYERWPVILGGGVWIVATVQYFLTQVIVASRWDQAYSWRTNYISDLGNTDCGPFAVPHGTSMYVCSPWHAAMNVSFMVSGVLTIAGAILLRRTWPRVRLTSIAFVLLVLAGLGKVMVGVFPENTIVGLHLLGALNIPLGSAAILLISLAIRHRSRIVADVGIALAALGAAGTIFSTAGQFAGSALSLGLGVGGMERVSAYPGNVWMLLIAVVAIWLVTNDKSAPNLR